VEGSLWNCVTLQPFAPLATTLNFTQTAALLPISEESVRRALKRLKTNWKRAKHWITSPDPQYLRKKYARDNLIAWACQQPDWAIGFLGRASGGLVLLSLVSLPGLCKEHPVRLEEQPWKKGDPDPKALACYGVLWQEGQPDDPQRDQIWLRFVTRRPGSSMTTQLLGW
jgi:hypothetical protein